MNALKTHKTEYFPQPVSSWVFFFLWIYCKLFSPTPQTAVSESIICISSSILPVFVSLILFNHCAIFLFLYSLAFEIFRRKKKETNTLSLTCHVLLNNKSTVHLAIVNGKVEQNTTALTSSKENAIKQGKWMCKKRVFILLRWPAIDTGRNVSLTTE